jgi:hypothetical protein
MMLDMPAIRWLAGPIAALAVGATACGGGDGGSSGGTAQRPTPTAGAEGTASADPDPPATPPKKKVAPERERIVRAWANTLRRGNVRGAARYFAVPSLVSNNTPPLKLSTRKQVQNFNRTLPCGAKVVESVRGPKGFVIVTFLLTERPGPGTCGTGVGAKVRTAFRIRKHHITDWVRVSDPPPEPEPDNVA